MLKISTKSKSHADYFHLDIDGKEYKIPLISAFKVKEAKKIQEMDIDAFIEMYVPKKVVDELYPEDLTAIIEEWRKASEEKAGATVGES